DRRVRGVHGGVGAAVPAGRIGGLERRACESDRRDREHPYQPRALHPNQYMHFMLDLRLMRAVIVSFVVVLLVACKNEGEPGSCYREPDNACVEYGQAMGGAGKRLCSSFKWTPGAKSCPTEN